MPAGQERSGFLICVRICRIIFLDDLSVRHDTALDSSFGHSKESAHMHAAVYSGFRHTVTDPYIGRVHDPSAETAHKRISGHSSLAVAGADLSFCRSHALPENSAD